MAGSRKTRPPPDSTLPLHEREQAHGAREIAGATLPSEVRDHADLLTTIEAEIIPRLVMAHRTDASTPLLCVENRPPPSEDEVRRFADVAAGHDLQAALGFIEAICRQGLALEVALLELVAPAARLLGDQWKADERSFTEVSAGLGILQQIVHVLGPSFSPPVPHRGLVALVAAPGEQHTLGLYLVGEFFRQAGWGVQVDPSMTRADVLDLLANEWVEMLGVTVSSGARLQAVQSLISEARRCSKNPRLVVMLGGSVDLQQALRSGATLCPQDAREAVRWLERHVEQSGSSH